MDGEGSSVEEADEIETVAANDGEALPIEAAEDDAEGVAATEAEETPKPARSRAKKTSTRKTTTRKKTAE